MLVGEDKELYFIYKKKSNPDYYFAEINFDKIDRDKINSDRVERNLKLEEFKREEAKLDKKTPKSLKAKEELNKLL